MKIGFITSLLSEFTFDEVIDAAAKYGYKCVEVACWPHEKADRRYSGVCHIDVDNLDDKTAEHILNKCKESNVEISSLAYYPNTLEPDLEKRAVILSHLYKVIDASKKLGVNMVTTFIGRDPSKNVEDNLEEVKKVWPAIVEYAKKQDVKIAIENCPMLFDENQWPGGKNLFNSPVIWRKIIDIINSDNFGINFDPSHFVWQQLDYIKPIYEFKDKMFHVHFKDMKVYPDKLAEYGILAYPLQYTAGKLPGLGDVNWGKFVSALTDIGFNGYACLEVEDRAFEGSKEDKLKSLELSMRYLSQFVI